MPKNNDVKPIDEYYVNYEHYKPENVENQVDKSNKNKQNQSPFAMPLNQNDKNVPNLQFFEEDSYKVVKKNGMKLKHKILLSLILLLFCLVLVCLLATHLSEHISTLF